MVANNLRKISPHPMVYVNSEFSDEVSRTHSETRTQKMRYAIEPNLKFN